MLTFATPLWLAGLLLVPVIRWLHRGGPHARFVPVSSLGLWRQATASAVAAGDRRPPDAAWRRRALMTSLLFVSLAQPQAVERRVPVTVWIDDSISMLTREGAGTRLVEGLAQVRSALAEAERADVEVRTLGNPWRNLGALNDATLAAIAEGAGRSEPYAPPAALLHRDRLHWLLTDGADAAVLDWPGDARPDRTFQLSGITRNVGLERLSARRNLDDPERYDVLVKVNNGGSVVEERTVILATGTREVARSTHRVEPGASAIVDASVPATGTVRAALQPGDALGADDEMVLALEALRRRRVAVDPGCPRALVAAVRSHPALAPIDPESAGAEAVLDCGSGATAPNVPRIRVFADRTPDKLRGSLRWSTSVPASARLRTDAEHLRLAARLEPRPGDTVLLAAGDAPLVVRRAGEPALLETALDFDVPVGADRPEVPLIADFLFERLFGGGLLDAIATVDRGSAATGVVPLRPADATPARDEPIAPRVLDAAPLLLAAALIVALWEILALGSQWLRSLAASP